MNPRPAAMREFDPRRLHLFYGTARQPCPYLPGREERKAAVALSGPGARALLDSLTAAGFRRTYSAAWRPACQGCDACVPVRIPVAAFRPSRSQRRVRRRNADLRARECPPFGTLEQYGVFRAYESSRHGGDMAAMGFGEFRAMIEDTPADTRMAEFRDADGRLAAAALLDRVADGLSAVYTFFAPGRERASPGVYAVLWLVSRARALGLPYVYLGYWIRDCPKMAYKTRFRPLEALVGGRWLPFGPQRFGAPAGLGTGGGADGGDGDGNDA